MVKIMVKIMDFSSVFQISPFNMTRVALVIDWVAWVAPHSGTTKARPDLFLRLVAVGKSYSQNPSEQCSKPLLVDD